MLFFAANKSVFKGRNAPKDLHPHLFMGSTPQILPYLDRAARALADPFDSAHFSYCPLEQFSSAVSDLLEPILVKVMYSDFML